MLLMLEYWAEPQHNDRVLLYAALRVVISLPILPRILLSFDVLGLSLKRYSSNSAPQGFMYTGFFFWEGKCQCVQQIHAHVSAPTRVVFMNIFNDKKLMSDLAIIH